jgi:hypothetical protein
MRLTVVACGLLIACRGNSDKPKPVPEPAAPLRLDAGLHAPSGVDPSALHLDDDVGGRPVTPPPGPNRPGRPIDVTLRSSPPGARVSVDGQPLGNTPAYWSGLADGHEHEFLFTLPRHAIARYRFVPVSSGVIHARLDPIAEDVDAGVPPPEVVPSQHPSLVVPTPAVPAPVALPPVAAPPADAAPVVTPPADAAEGTMPGLGPQP